MKKRSIFLSILFCLTILVVHKKAESLSFRDIAGYATSVFNCMYVPALTFLTLDGAFKSAHRFNIPWNALVMVHGLKSFYSVSEKFYTSEHYDSKFVSEVLSETAVGLICTTIGYNQLVSHFNRLKLFNFNLPELLLSSMPKQAIARMQVA